jgi:hypothetical protein
VTLNLLVFVKLRTGPLSGVSTNTPPATRT